MFVYKKIDKLCPHDRRAITRDGPAVSGVIIKKLLLLGHALAVQPV